MPLPSAVSHRQFLIAPPPPPPRPLPTILPHGSSLSLPLSAHTAAHVAHFQTRAPVASNDEASGAGEAAGEAKTEEARTKKKSSLAGLSKKSKGKLSASASSYVPGGGGGGGGGFSDGDAEASDAGDDDDDGDGEESDDGDGEESDDSSVLSDTSSDGSLAGSDGSDDDQPDLSVGGAGGVGVVDHQHFPTLPAAATMPRPRLPYDYIASRAATDPAVAKAKVRARQLRREEEAVRVQKQREQAAAIAAEKIFAAEVAAKEEQHQEAVQARREAAQRAAQQAIADHEGVTQWEAKCKVRHEKAERVKAQASKVVVENAKAVARAAERKSAARAAAAAAAKERLQAQTQATQEATLDAARKAIAAKKAVDARAAKAAHASEAAAERSRVCADRAQLERSRAVLSASRNARSTARWRARVVSKIASREEARRRVEDKSGQKAVNLDLMVNILRAVLLLFAVSLVGVTLLHQRNWSAAFRPMDYVRGVPTGNIGLVGGVAAPPALCCDVCDLDVLEDAQNTGNGTEPLASVFPARCVVAKIAISGASLAADGQIGSHSRFRSDIRAHRRRCATSCAGSSTVVPEIGAAGGGAVTGSMADVSAALALTTTLRGFVDANRGCLAADNIRATKAAVRRRKVAFTALSAALNASNAKAAQLPSGPEERRVRTAVWEHYALGVAHCDAEFRTANEMQVSKQSYTRTVFEQAVGKLAGVEIQFASAVMVRREEVTMLLGLGQVRDRFQISCSSARTCALWVGSTCVLLVYAIPAHP